MRKRSQKRKLTSKFFIILSVSVVLLIILSELVVFIISNLYFDGQSVAYIVPLYVMPVVALVFTAVVITMTHFQTGRAATLNNAIHKVADGDYTVELELNAGSEFNVVYENFNKMVKELSSVQLLKEDFVRNFAHELKTPISSINGFANLLLEGGLSREEEIKLYKIIAEESLRLWKLADNTLILSKIENQQIAGESKILRLDLQIKEAVILLESEWTKKNIEINSDMDVAEVKCDSALLKQVWVNLLSNAIKFTPNGGKIFIKLNCVNGNAYVSIADTGIGIPSADLPYIFEKHYRAGNALGIADGTGLGLVICKRVLGLVGGQISVDSREGEGSVFTVTLPTEN